MVMAVERQTASVESHNYILLMDTHRSQNHQQPLTVCVTIPMGTIVVPLLLLDGGHRNNVQPASHPFHPAPTNRQRARHNELISITPTRLEMGHRYLLLLLRAQPATQIDWFEGHGVNRGQTGQIL